MKNYKKRNRKLSAFLWMLGAFLFFSGNLFGQAVTFSFANAKMTDGSGGVGTTHYEVDVMISTDTDLKLGIGQFYIDYNTAAFGSSIAGGGLTTNHPAGSETGYILDTRVFGGFANFYNALGVVNNTTSKVSFDWNQAQTAANLPAANVTVAGSPTLLIHLTILYTNNTADPMITFDAVLSNDLSNTAGDGLLGSGAPSVNITDDTYDSSGSKLVNNWTGTTDTDWDTTTNWSLGSIPTGTTSVTISDVANDPVASGAISVDEMTLNAGAKLTVNGAVTNNSTMIINSGASLIAKTSVSGNINYNRSLGSTNWHLISSPVSGQDIDAFEDVEGLATGTNANNVGLSDYNNTTPGWEYYQSGASGTGNFVSGDGRSIKLAATGDIAFTGSMPVSDVGVSITSNTNGFNLIGNPYPSFIPANTNADGTNNILTINSSDLTEQTIWFWNQGTSAYQPVNQASASRFIAPAQGFFVSSSGSNTFNFTETMQSHQTDNFQRNGSARPEIKLSISDGSQLKETEIYYISGTTIGWDNGYDSSLFGGGDHSFAVYTQLVADNAGQDLGIQSLPDNDYENMIIPVGVNATSGTEITISATSLNLPTGIQVYLEDRNDNTFTLLDATSDFTATLSNNEDGIGRFYLHTSAQVLSLGGFNLNHVSLFLSNRNNLRITGIHSGDTKVTIHDILGKEVLRTSFEGNGVNDVALPNLRSSVYIVQVETQKGRLNKKIIIQ